MSSTQSRASRCMQAALADDSDAMVELAWMFRCGVEVKKDVPWAVALYRLAADLGNDKAMLSLGETLVNGDIGVERDIPAAAAILRQAADRGNDGAMVLLGCLLQRGMDGVETDQPAAASLFRQAADLGNIQGMFNLAVMLNFGADGVQEDWTESISLYRRAADRGHVEAMNNLANMVLRGFGVARDVSGALELYERAVRSFHKVEHETNLAKLLLSEDIGTRRDPPRAAELLEEALKKNPTYGPALHELAVLYTLGDDGVPQDKQRAASLHRRAAADASYEEVRVRRADRLIIEAGEEYVEVVEEILRRSSVKPRTCTLLTLGGGGRGKTCTANSLRGMPFVACHVPTEMADLNRFIIEPGVHGLTEDVISEFDFNENSLRANVSRLHREFVPETEIQSRIRSMNASAGTLDPLEPARPQRPSRHSAERSHEDVIERVRRSLVQEDFPVGFKGAVVQVWDLAGQSQYEMAHSLLIARGGILVFFTDLERVSDEGTRQSEVRMLCYWMQLAHILVPDPFATRVLIVGTRKSKCKEGIFGILRACLVEQLAPKVFNSWIRTQPSEERSTTIPKFIAIENSDALENPERSGLDELERAVKAAGDEIVALRDAVPLRWLALVDKLERQQHASSRMYFSKDDVQELSAGFPGFVDDECERERDVLDGLRCFATMGRLVLFECSEEEWYVFMDAQKIIDIVGKVTAPEERVRDRLYAEDVRGLKQGKILLSLESDDLLSSNHGGPAITSSALRSRAAPSSATLQLHVPWTVRCNGSTVHRRHPSLPSARVVSCIQMLTMLTSTRRRREERIQQSNSNARKSRRLVSRKSALLLPIGSRYLFVLPRGAATAHTAEKWWPCDSSRISRIRVQSMSTVDVCCRHLQPTVGQRAAQGDCQDRCPTT